MTVVNWGWAGRALGVVSGDLHVVVPFPGGMLVALIDGLGHGHEAAEAAAAAAALLEAHAADPVLTLIHRCHEGLRKTRGAVMSITSFNVGQSSMTWTGVGNVAGVLLRVNATERGDAALSPRSGVVGFQLPSVRADTCAVSPGDTLIFASDGVNGGFASSLVMAHSPQEIAEGIIARFAKNSDDAHVVVARYVGEAT